MVLYVDALDATFFPCRRDLLAEFKAFQADIVFQADDFDWRAPCAASRPSRPACSPAAHAHELPARCAQHDLAVWALHLK